MTRDTTTLDAAAVRPLLLDAREASMLCGVSLRSWHRLVSSGDVPQPVRIGHGRLVRWRRADLEDWVAGLGSESR